MNKVQTVIASTLKPVDDPRSYKRFGLSMAKTNKYAINIIGFGVKNKSNNPDINFHGLGVFKRLSYKRLIAKWIVYQKIRQLKPDLLIIQTHELIIPAILYKVLFKKNVVYDVRENYFSNLVHQNNFPFIIKHLLAYWVRAKEIISSNFFDGYLLAEVCYQNELKFHLKKSFKVIENKVQIERTKTSLRKEVNQFIFTGNLSHNSGVLKAIEIFESVQEKMPKPNLKIIGFAPSKNFLNVLKTRVEDNSKIELIGGNSPVSHELILNAIQESSFGIVTYTLNPSNQNCIPTKVYEYLAMDLPFICEAKTGWALLGRKSGKSIAIDFKSYSVNELVLALNSYKNSVTPTDNSQFIWSSEESKLLDFIDQIIS